LSNTIQKRSAGRHFSPNYPVAPPQATQRTKRSKTQRKLLNFGLSRRGSISRPAQKSWKLRSREYAVLGSRWMDCIGRMVTRPSDREIASQRALPCLHSPTRHSRLAQTWFCVGKPKRKPPKVASFKWSPGNRRYAREQADSDRHLEKHHQRSGLNCRRFSLKQIRGLADETPGSVFKRLRCGKWLIHPGRFDLS